MVSPWFFPHRNGLPHTWRVLFSHHYDTMKCFTLATNSPMQSHEHSHSHTLMGELQCTVLPTQLRAFFRWQRSPPTEPLSEIRRHPPGFHKDPQKHIDVSENSRHLATPPRCFLSQILTAAILIRVHSIAPPLPQLPAVNLQTFSPESHSSILICKASLMSSLQSFSEILLMRDNCGMCSPAPPPSPSTRQPRPAIFLLLPVVECFTF